MVAWSDRGIKSTGQGETPDIVAMKMDQPVGSDIAIRRHPMIGISRSPFQPGMTHPFHRSQTGGTNLRPRSLTGAGSDVNKPEPMLGYNERFNPYCTRPDDAGAMLLDSDSENRDSENRESPSGK